MVKRTAAVIFIMLSVLQCSVFAAGSLYKTEIRQIYCYKDLIKVYTDFLDPENIPINIAETSSIAGNIDSVELVTRSVKRFADTGEAVADIFLVDASGSVRDRQLLQVKNAIKLWISNMGGNDRIAVLTFGDNCTVRADFTNDKSALNTAVDGITNNDSHTQLYGGIMEALNLAGRNDADLPERRNIILITDGINDYNGGVRADDMYDELKKQLIPVYSMRVSGGAGSGDEGISTLNTVAEYSGGVTYDMADQGIEEVYNTIRENIMNTSVVEFAYNTVVPDNERHLLGVRASSGDIIAEDTAEFTLKINNEDSGSYSITSNNDEAAEPAETEQAETEAPAEEEETKTESDENNLFFVLVGALALAAIAAAVTIIVLINKDKDDEPYAAVEAEDNFEQKTVGASSMAMTAKLSGMPVRFISMLDNSSNTVCIADSIIVGRNSDNGFIVSKPTVSGMHAVITRDGVRLLIEDLSSKNGTFVNGRMILKITGLNSGDIVAFGAEEYKIQF